MRCRLQPTNFNTLPKKTKTAKYTASMENTANTVPKLKTKKKSQSKPKSRNKNQKLKNKILKQISKPSADN